MLRGEEVLLDGEPAEEFDVLEGASEPGGDALVREHALDRGSAENDAPRLRLHEPGDRIEQRRLAGAVRAEQSDDLAGLDRDRHVVERGDPAEPHGEPLRGQDGPGDPGRLPRDVGFGHRHAFDPK